MSGDLSPSELREKLETIAEVRGIIWRDTPWCTVAGSVRAPDFTAPNLAQIFTERIRFWLFGKENSQIRPYDVVEIPTSVLLGAIKELQRNRGRKWGPVDHYLEHIDHALDTLYECFSFGIGESSQELETISLRNLLRTFQEYLERKINSRELRSRTVGWYEGLR